jgi:hypothetical protein
VAVHGNLALVGASIGDAAAISNSGSAYLFDLTTGQQIRKITANDAAIGDQFGATVALNDLYAVIGSPNANERVKI